MLSFHQRTWHVHSPALLPRPQTGVLTTRYSPLTDLHFLGVRGPAPGLVAARVQRFEAEALQRDPKSVSAPRPPAGPAGPTSPTSPSGKGTAGKGKHKVQAQNLPPLLLQPNRGLFLLLHPPE